LRLQRPVKTGLNRFCAVFVFSNLWLTINRTTVLTKDRSIPFAVFIGYGLVRLQFFSSFVTGLPNTKFMGFEYRVKIDEDWCHKPLVIKAGNVVDILKTNMQYSCYVIDLCQMIRDGRAYFPVHYREYYGQGFTNASDPCHPSFILNIPELFCHSLVVLHL